MKTINISGSELTKIFKENPESRDFLLSQLEKERKFQEKLTFKKVEADMFLKTEHFKVKSRVLDLKETALKEKAALAKQRQEDAFKLGQRTATYGLLYMLVATSVGGFLIYKGHDLGAVAIVAGNLSTLKAIFDKFRSFIPTKIEAKQS